jgi:RNA polymerase sigma-70 factor (ECF subfamily)
VCNLADDPPHAAERAVEAAARRSYGKLLAFLAARTRDLAGAEDALSEAFASALVTWPADGVPRAPEAWLLAVARRRAIDAVRRRQVREAAMDPLRMLAEEAGDPGSAIPDERLRLMFACAHPALDASVRAPLMLQCVLGFDAAAIGLAFLIAPATIGQRLVRAKRKIRDAGVPFRVPEPDELAERLEAVLDAIYAVFAAGWTDPALAEEAIWLGRLVASLLDQEPEALGLLALMLHVQARLGARRDADGGYVPLAAQDPADWQDELTEEAEALLLRASRMRRIGRFQLEAAIQSAHAARRLTGRTPWGEIVALYDALLARTGSPVVALNRAVALGELHGPAAGLAALDGIAEDRRMLAYQSYWAARAALLAGVGDTDAADEAYARAIELEPDQAVRRFLQQRRI